MFQVKLVRSLSSSVTTTVTNIPEDTVAGAV